MGEVFGLMGCRSGLFLRKIFAGEGSKGSGLGGSCGGGRGATAAAIEAAEPVATSGGDRST